MSSAVPLKGEGMRAKTGAGIVAGLIAGIRIWPEPKR